ncbi:MAG TPA: hypothetical protein ENI69_09115, partial [Rhodospirillales bacterium]|nr:hypothetical protein [Rhodospirillales bacterium]
MVFSISASRINESSLAPAPRRGTMMATSRQPSNPTDTGKRMYFKNKSRPAMMAKGSDRLSSSQSGRGRYGKMIRVVLLPGLLAGVLVSCSALQQTADDFEELGRGLRGLDSNAAIEFVGAVVADEPKAALAGREALIAGGNAFDAATATYFALSVTMPSTAGLGGGGVCVVHDAASNKSLALDFLSRPSAQIANARLRPNAVPGNVRGFFALHSRYGRLPWAQLVGPAESMARFGTRVSRAFAADLDKIGSALLADREARRVFGRTDGGLKREGDKIIQPGLAETLGGVRKLGVEYLYKGAGAERFAATVAAAGGSLSGQDLIDFRPVWRNTLKLPLGDITVHFAPPPAAAGALAAEIWAMLMDGRRYQSTPDKAKPHLLAEAAMRAYAGRAGWMAADGSITLDVGELASRARIKALMKSYRLASHTAAETLNPPPKKNPDDPSAATF